MSRAGRLNASSLVSRRVHNDHAPHVAVTSTAQSAFRPSPTLLVPRHLHKLAMPKIKTTRTKKPPEGFEDIEGVCSQLLASFKVQR